MKKSSTIIALVGTAFSYWLAYTFQASYLRYFGVSAYEVEVSINNLAIALGVLVIVLLALDSLGDFYRKFLGKVDSDTPKDRYLRRLARSGIGILLVIAYLYSTETIALLGISLTFVAIFLVFAAEPLFYLRKGVGFNEALHKMYDKLDTAETQPKKYLSYMEKFREYIAGGIFLMVIASFTGYVYAQMATNLYVIKTDGHIKQLLVLKNGDTYVTRPYNTQSGSFEPGYTVHKLQDQLTLNERVQIKQSYGGTL